MISLRLAAAILTAAAIAACFTYFVTPSSPVDAHQAGSTVPNLVDRPDTGASIDTDQRPSAEGKTAAAYREAAEAILKRASNARADARAEVPPIAEHIPLPKRRPIMRP